MTTNSHMSGQRRWPLQSQGCLPDGCAMQAENILPWVKKKKWRKNVKWLRPKCVWIGVFHKEFRLNLSLKSQSSKNQACIDKLLQNWILNKILSGLYKCQGRFTFKSWHGTTLISQREVAFPQIHFKTVKLRSYDKAATWTLEYKERY